jgi:hypothetical protein
VREIWDDRMALEKTRSSKIHRRSSAIQKRVGDGHRNKSRKSMAKKKLVFNEEKITTEDGNAAQMLFEFHRCITSVASSSSESTSA